MGVIEKIERGDRFKVEIYIKNIDGSEEWSYLSENHKTELLHLAKLGAAALEASNRNDYFFKDNNVCLPIKYGKLAACKNEVHPCKWRNFCKLRKETQDG